MTLQYSTAVRAGVWFYLGVAVATCSRPSDPPAPIPAAVAPPEPTPQVPFTTVIVDKVDHASGSLTLHFAVAGGTISHNINDFRFLCRRDGAEAFAVCPDGSIYRFSGLKAGQSYELTVQAISISTRLVAAPDHLRFTGQFTP